MNAKDTKPARKSIRLDSATRDLAASLRDSISATDSKALKEDPEETFIDFAHRFVRQLHGRGLTIVPLPTREDQMQLAMDRAAARELQIFTEWMRSTPGASYDTRMSVTGKFQVILRTPEGPKVSFGGDVQDAYGQATVIIQASKDAP